MSSMICVLPLGGFAAPALAQSVPAGLRACAADPDPGRRLDCYDSEMKRLMASPAPAAGAEPPPPAARLQPPAQVAPSAMSAAQPAAAQAEVASPPPPAPARAASVPASQAANAADGASAPAHHTPAWKKLLTGDASHVIAHIVRVHRSPDSMTLDLDNGQVWRQVGRATGDLGLRAGDEVNIEEDFGSYYLSSRHVSGMKVRLETQ
jgi:hypothetical protein